MRWGRGLAAGVLAAALTATAAVAVPSPQPTVDAVVRGKGARTITYVGVDRDRADLTRLVSLKGGWFPLFNAARPVDDAPTSSAFDRLPRWVAAFNHTTSPADPGCGEVGALERGCLPTYAFRTFSQDGPARAMGGQPGWATLTLPDGQRGPAGAIVDPHTAGNVNNTVNRIQLTDETPASFVVGVITDVTAGQFEPERLELRGSAGLLDVPQELAGTQVESAFPSGIDLRPNGRPDIHLFRVDGFASGDYLKLRLRGGRSGAGFGGLLFYA